MNIPNFLDQPIATKRDDGQYYWSDGWRTIMMQLFQQLQQNAGQEGFNPGAQTAANITTIQPNAQQFTIIGDSTNNELKVKLADGNFHVIQTS